MKQLSIFPKLIVLFAALGLFITSCDPDIIDPTLSFSDETGYVSSDATIAANEVFLVKVSGTSGSADMNTLTIQKDGVNLSTDEYTVDGAVDNNPKLLFDTERSSFTYEIAITGEDSGSATYSFVVNSDDDGRETRSLEITVDGVGNQPILTNDMNSSIEIDNPGIVRIVLTAVKGNAALSSISVLEEGVLITDLTRLEWDSTQGSEEWTSNPQLLEGEDVEGFTAKELLLRSNDVIGTTNYTITLADENGSESSIDYSITIVDTLVDVATGVLLYNNSGPNFGAIDLETGTNVTSVSNPDADIIDQGIDGDGNWLQIIAPADATTSLRSIDAAYTYENVTSKELLIKAYDGGTELAQTGTLMVGSTYVAKRDDVYYMMTVTEVNPTTDDNLDNLVWDIKKGE